MRLRCKDKRENVPSEAISAFAANANREINLFTRRTVFVVRRVNLLRRRQ